MFEKRGLSAVVTTLIIILLAIVSIGIVWVVVRNVLQEGSEEITLGQFTYDLSIKTASIDGSDVKVNVRRSPGGDELAGVKFIFYDGSDSYILEKKIALKELEERTFTFNSTEVGDVNSLQEVSIAPIYISSGNEKIGEITDTADISGSGTGGNGGNGNGGAVCGNSIIESGETCDDGNTVSGDGCSSTCQSEGSGSCNNDGTCDPTETPGSCPNDCGTPSSCDGVWNPGAEDAGVVCDGSSHCLATCVCEIGFTADGSGGCNLNPPLSTGTINSVWNNIFFDSHNLPKDSSVSDYAGDYVNFSNSLETSCFQITFASYLNATNISYLRIDDELGAPNILINEGYNIWEATNCGA